MKITISNKQVFIDKSNLELINLGGWCFDGRYIEKRVLGKKVYLHRLIMKAGENQEVDHIDRNKLNNQKSNLRFCSRSLNVFNTGLKSNNKSGYKGVCWDNTKKRWRVYIDSNKKRIQLGYLKDFSKAVVLRKNAELEWGATK